MTSDNWSQIGSNFLGFINSILNLRLNVDLRKDILLLQTPLKQGVYDQELCRLCCKNLDLTWGRKNTPSLVEKTTGWDFFRPIFIPLFVLQSRSKRDRLALDAESYIDRTKMNAFPYFVYICNCDGSLFWWSKLIGQRTQCPSVLVKAIYSAGMKPPEYSFLSWRVQRVFRRLPS